MINSERKEAAEEAVEAYQRLSGTIEAAIKNGADQFVHSQDALSQYENEF